MFSETPLPMVSQSNRFVLASIRNFERELVQYRIAVLPSLETPHEDGYVKGTGIFELLPEKVKFKYRFVPDILGPLGRELVEIEDENTLSGLVFNIPMDGTGGRFGILGFLVFLVVEHPETRTQTSKICRILIKKGGPGTYPIPGPVISCELFS